MVLSSSDLTHPPPLLPPPQAWRAAMPRVLPFYAVKCHPEPAVLRLLIAMGAGFDCASKGELQMMLDMGVHPSRIIFAHPCKRACDIRFARENGVTLTTFDTESELHKMAAQFPGFRWAAWAGLWCCSGLPACPRCPGGPWL